MSLRLGVIGFSAGNGHPYSWSAIINGYSPELMAHCGFPVISQYLAEKNWPEARIPGAEVTHVWTQSIELSQQIADASLISHVVSAPEEMIGQVDAVLLARDDSENHLHFAAPFLRAGMPIYIDKPIATSISALQSLYALQKYEGQIFTCSALRYAREFQMDPLSRENLGPIRYVHASNPKTWEKYAVHTIEPVLMMLGEVGLPMTANIAPIAPDGRVVTMEFPGRVTATFSSLGTLASGPMSIRVHGETAWKEMIFSDTFSAFKAALEDFIGGVKSGTCRSSPIFNRRVVSLIEMGVAI